MPLFCDLAITPSVFRRESYDVPETARFHLSRLKAMILEEGIVRDLGDGEWSKTCLADIGELDPMAKELLKKIRKGRSVPWPKLRHECLETDVDWCREALAEMRSPVMGIVTSSGTVAAMEGVQSDPRLGVVDRLDSAQWWLKRGCSVYLGRSSADYLREVDPLLRYANSLIFVDPYLDPREARYGVVAEMLERIGARRPKPLIEFHRRANTDGRDKRNSHSPAEWQGIFDRWSNVLGRCELSAEVFLWDDFHDRYLITDLMGISLPYGFATTTDPKAMTTWCRLSRVNRDQVQKEFDPNNPAHQLLADPFRIGHSAG